ncbi:Similar to glycogen synthase [Mucinivorans hirudinis]|uniref:starch synthase n=1 Tax=Mucinivorans hirudinis TaxID=1433126 RepID=A0A060RDP2_9BACT|nr:Similar to glycogen synthase [Mucinivorans hirudinis]
MSNRKILYICPEVTPYLPQTHISTICRFLPQAVQEAGNEVRVFMPRFGNINERRNQLHEVIRLSGLNLIIDDTDHQLIIKVASIPGARMQIYFIDNEDFFSRKATEKDSEEQSFADNDERMMFFARGVLETVKKLRWSPSIVHCHGWFSLFAPMYLKKIFKDDPIFNKAKVILSLYNNNFEGTLDPAIKNKIKQEGIKVGELTNLEEPTYLNLHKFAMQYSDGVVFAHPDVDKDLAEYIISTGKTTLEYHDNELFTPAYTEFYEQILSK